MIITREQFLGAKKLRTQDVPIGDGQEIRVRQPTVAEWDEFDIEGPHYRARLVLEFAMDERGQRLFQDDDLPRLMVLGSDRIELVSSAILDLAGATRRALEALAKNLRSTPKSSSAPVSPDTSASPGPSSAD